MNVSECNVSYTLKTQTMLKMYNLIQIRNRDSNLKSGFLMCSAFNVCNLINYIGMQRVESIL